jgi:hypothetical protein
LLKALPLQDAGALAAVSGACFNQLKVDLGAACRETRRCVRCGATFNYLTGRDDCRYHPGQEQVTLVGDGPGTGMMDVSWTCCGRGAAYCVGIAMPCTQSEIHGCCARPHRAQRMSVREAASSNGL